MASERESDNIPYEMRGAHVSVKGKVIKVINHNPFTRARTKERQYRYLLSPIYIFNKKYDHLWVSGCKKTMGVTKGDTISFFAKLSTYETEGVKKWNVKFPYKNFTIEHLE
uniref:Uncharacterized protein n=1 Tax=Marseillevirus LCMAC101 TaxID=2506602 RepID=A0A481YRR6_9VIRU|nr:MAG: uncharacterized protein LCMAC101_05580 [Marseillevirus LCMAC101]